MPTRIQKRAAIIKTKTKEFRKALKLLEEIEVLDLLVKVESKKVYAYIPDCQLHYREPEPTFYKPVNIEGNEWILLEKNGRNWYAMNNGKVYTKKNPTIDDFVTHFSRGRNY